jgi:hypothetical protein
MKILQILALIFGFTLYVNAQNAVLSGIIYDQMGAAIGKANIEFRGTNNELRVVTTNEDGEYVINLASGSYSIEIEAVGFKVYKIENFNITKSYKGKMNLDVVLEVKPCSDPTVNCDLIIGEPIKIPKKNNIKKRRNNKQ